MAGLEFPLAKNLGNKNDDILINMVEAEANEIQEEVILEAEKFSHPFLKKLINFQKEIIEKIGKEKIKIRESAKDLEIEKLVVKTGQTYKRMRPVSRGRAHRILKRTCHIEAVLKTKQATTVKTSKVTAKKHKAVAKQTKVKVAQKATKIVASKIKTQQIVVPVKKDSSKVTKQSVAPVKMHSNRRASSSR